ncbi:clampless1 Clp1 protein [Rhizoctonia solani]|uniref:Clampless1 Clp1 protein n=1 Tax=Rhizoctonia solani TaxID=456999 RepID=A0A8H8T2G3_9AGAM|nr:clampless1 Clp1 protein [Rhizoctonia solani]QRW26849.1 clampless1 Clp1 protein [Rhizoctonia solani]
MATSGVQIPQVPRVEPINPTRGPRSVCNNPRHINPDRAVLSYYVFWTHQCSSATAHNIDLHDRRAYRDMNMPRSFSPSPSPPSDQNEFSKTRGKPTLTPRRPKSHRNAGDIQVSPAYAKGRKPSLPLLVLQHAQPTNTLSRAQRRPPTDTHMS